MNLSAVALAPARRLSLAEELAELQVPVLPKDRIRAHKRMMIRAAHPGIWRFLMPFLLMVCAISATVALLLPVAAISSAVWKSEASVKKACTILSRVEAVLFVSGLLLPLPPMLSLLLLLPLSGYMIAWAIFATALRRISLWRETPLATARRLANVPKVPAHIEPRIAAAAFLADAEVVVEHFGMDPLVAVVRGPWFWREKQYIGAYKTGTDLDRF